MAGRMFDFQPDFFTKYDEGCLFIFAESENYSEYLVTEQFAIARHCGVQCKYERCKYHVMLYSNSLEDTWKILKEKTFKYHIVDATYAYYKFYILNGSMIESTGDIMDSLYKAVMYNRTHPSLDTRPSVLRKRLHRKKRKVHYKLLNIKSIAMQTIENSLSSRIFCEYGKCP